MTTSQFSDARAASGTDETSDAAFAEQLRSMLLFLRRNFRLISVAAIVAVVLAVIYIINTEPRFRSTVLLMVEHPSGSPVEDELRRAGDSPVTYVDGQLFVMESADLLSEVILRENLRADPDFQPKAPSGLDLLKSTIFGSTPPTPGIDPLEQYALRELDRAISANREGDSNVVAINVLATTPLKAARIANTLADVYIESRHLAQAKRASQVAGWLDDRVVEVQRKLTVAEDAVARFRAENSLLDAEKGFTLSQQQLLDMSTELVATRAELAEKSAAYSRALVVQKNGSDAQALPQIDNSAIIVDLRTTLLALQRRESELVRNSNPSDRRLITVRQHTAEIENQLASEVDRIVRMLGTEVSTLEAREKLLTVAVSEASGRSGSEGQTQVELNGLERVAESYRALYERYLASASLAREGATFLIGGSQIVNSANVPQNPVFPPKKVLLILSILFGAGAGALIAMLRELNEPGIVTAAQAEKSLGLNVIACLPALLKGTTPLSAIRKSPTGNYAEAINLVRHGLVRPGIKGPTPVLLVTSTSAGEGKTGISSAIAQSAFGAGRKVMLIDADFRRMGTSKLFGCSKDPGLTEILRGQNPSSFFEDIPDGPLLDVLPAGRATSGTSDLLGSAEMQRFIALARAHYDLVVIDGPPVANLADAESLAAISDHVAFVVKWKTTPRNLARMVLRRLGAAEKCRIVLNAVDIAEIANYGEIYDYDNGDTRQITFAATAPAL